MSFLPFAICGLLGLGVSVLLIRLVLWASRRREPTDHGRDLHHTHEVPVPRLGGVALAGAFVAVKLFVLASFSSDPHTRFTQFVIAAGALAMFGLGLWDDLRGLGARRKLAGQIVIAAAVYYCGIRIDSFGLPFSESVIDLGWFGGLVTVFWLVALTNLINLIDGIDGLAGGICLLLMVLLAYQGQGTHHLPLVATGLIGALAGFLRFNFPPARIYMGDGGAYFLGFLIGLITIVSSNKGDVAAGLVAPLFVLALPIIDTSLAILRRGTHGLPVFRPDRRHIHHRLVGMGLSRRKVVLALYAFTVVFLLMAFAVSWSQGRYLPVLLGLATLVVLLCAGTLSFSREWFAVGHVLGNSLRMRQEVQYAQSLLRCLELEGDRSRSVESLWEDFVFVARKLGFVGVRLALPDGARAWEARLASPTDFCARHELQGGQMGTVELRACSRAAETEACAACPVAQLAPERDCRTISTFQLFEILSELMAEGWLKAARRWTARQTAPANLSFTPVRADGAPQPSERPQESVAGVWG